MADRPIPLILFAKQPRPGAVKTRLQPPLSPRQAASVAAILIRLSLARAMRCWPGTCVLALAPLVPDDPLSLWAHGHDISLVAQGDGDLGERMARALAGAGGPAVIMGCDVPHCSEQILHQAHSRLAAGEYVLGPSFDGGYYLIGMPRSRPELLQGISWGTARVAAQTRARAAAGGLCLHELPTLRDIDEWSDVMALRSRLPVLDRYLRSQSLL